MNELILDGKKYKLSPELVEKIKSEVAAQEKAENPFERNIGELYYFVDSAGGIFSFTDYKSGTADALYSAGNYCRDKAVMEQRALHETLNRLLWRYSETHGGCEELGGFFIYQSSSGDMYVGHCTYAGCGDVYFKTRAAAVAAIDDVVNPFMAEHPEFVW